jgi:hypothetical protein
MAHNDPAFTVAAIRRRNRKAKEAFARAARGPHYARRWATASTRPRPKAPFATTEATRARQPRIVNQRSAPLADSDVCQSKLGGRHIREAS